MKSTLIVNEEKYQINYDLNHYESDDYLPIWKAWTKFDEILENPNKFFKVIIIFVENNKEDLSSLSHDLKEKVLYKIYEDSMEFKKKESDFLTYHHTGDISSSSYSNLNFSWIKFDKKPILVKVFVDTLGEEFEIRQSGEKNKYIKKDQDGEMVRDSQGELVYLSDDEVLKKELALYDTSVYAFTTKGECVGYTSDEWGADGVWVLPNFQKRGIGMELLSIHRSQYKESRKMGQMTHAGVRLALSYFRKNN